MVRFLTNLFLLLIVCVPVLGQQLLPDLVVRLDELYDHEVIPAGFAPRMLTLSNGTANIGAGKLYLYGVHPDNGDSVQPVMQRIFNQDNSYTDVLSGNFVYHPQHGHIHFEDWSIYRLREITAGGDVGAVIASSEKTSFCILDTDIHDVGLLGFSPNPYFVMCDVSIQGLSVGWFDVYTKELPGQSISLDGVPDGIYWLESEVDPVDNVLESDETNNISRIQVVIGNIGTIPPDRFEPNQIATEVNAREVGAPNSPNLGPCGPATIIQGLTINSQSDDDLYRFYLPAVGTADDDIRIDFDNNLGDLDLELLNNNGGFIEGSSSNENFEQISLDRRLAGWYYARVRSGQGDLNPYYALTINPSENSAPTISISDPPVGTQIRIHGFETYTTRWNYSDLELNSCWVTVYADSTPVSTGDEILFPSSVNTTAGQGFFVINSAYVPPGTYGIYASITDGGSWSEGRSLGMVNFVECPYRPGDVNDDGDGPNIVDITFLVDYLFRGGALPPNMPSADVNASGKISILDLTRLVAFLFRGGTTPACG